MVEINNQRKAFPRYAGVVGGNWIPDVRKPETRLATSVESYLLITPITLANLSLPNSKLKSTGADITTFFLLVGCLPQAAWPERLSKVRTPGISKDYGACALPMIDRGGYHLSGNRPLQQYLASLLGAGYIARRQG